MSDVWSSFELLKSNESVFEAVKMLVDFLIFVGGLYLTVTQEWGVWRVVGVVFLIRGCYLWWKRVSGGGESG